MLLSFDFLVGVNACWREEVGKVPSAESGKFLDLLLAGGRRVAGQVINRKQRTVTRGLAYPVLSLRLW